MSLYNYPRMSKGYTTYVRCVPNSGLSDSSKIITDLLHLTSLVTTESKETISKFRFWERDMNESNNNMLGAAL